MLKMLKEIFANLLKANIDFKLERFPPPPIMLVRFFIRFHNIPL